MKCTIIYKLFLNKIYIFTSLLSTQKGNNILTRHRSLLFCNEIISVCDMTKFTKLEKIMEIYGKNLLKYIFSKISNHVGNCTFRAKMDYFSICRLFFIYQILNSPAEKSVFLTVIYLPNFKILF